MIVYKNLPSDFSEQYLLIMYALSITQFKDFKVEGTFNEKGMLYPSDVDCFENIIYKNKTNVIKNISESLNKVISVLSKLKNIYISGIIIGLRNDKPLHWTIQDLKKGINLNITLEDAIQMKSIIKIDVIAYINSVYIDFSCTYQFFNQEKLINDYPLFQNKDLERDVEKYKEEHNYYKMAKRLYVLKQDPKLKDFFNSNTGNINQVISNIDTLIYILENMSSIPFKNIDSEIDGFINRLNSLDDKNLIKVSSNLNKILRDAESTKSKTKAIKDLNTIKTKLNNIVQDNTKQYLTKIKIL